MKRIETMVLAMLLLSLPVAAQQSVGGASGLDKFITQASNKNKAPMDFYHVKIRGGMPVESLSAFCMSNDLIVAKSDLRKEYRFGEIVNDLYSIDFLPRDMYPVYLLNNTGVAGTLCREDLKPAKALYFLDIEGQLSHKEDMQWTGAVKDGWADGEGTAICYVKAKNLYLIMKGVFRKGIPVGRMDYYFYQNNNSYYSEGNLRKNGIEVSATGGEGLRSFKQPDGGNFSVSGLITVVRAKTDWGFIDEAGNVVIKPQFSSVISEFNNGKAIVYSNYREILIDKTGKYVGDSEHQQKFDYDQALSHVRIVGKWDASPRNWDYMNTRDDLLKAYKDDEKALEYILKYRDENFRPYFSDIAVHHSQLGEILGKVNNDYRRRIDSLAKEIEESEKASKLKEAKDNNAIKISKSPDTKITATLLDHYDYKMTGGIVTTGLGRNYPYTVYYDDGAIYGYSWEKEANDSRWCSTWEKMEKEIIEYDNEL